MQNDISNMMIPYLNIVFVGKRMIEFVWHEFAKFNRSTTWKEWNLLDIFKSVIDMFNSNFDEHIKDRQYSDIIDM